MLDVEHGHPQRLVALERAVGERVAHAGHPRAHALRRREPVQSVARRQLRELLDQLIRGPRARPKLGDAVAGAQAIGEGGPVERELAGRGVELAQTAVLCGMQPRGRVASSRGHSVAGSGCSEPAVTRSLNEYRMGIWYQPECSARKWVNSSPYQ